MLKTNCFSNIFFSYKNQHFVSRIPIPEPFRVNKWKVFVHPLENNIDEYRSVCFNWAFVKYINRFNMRRIICSVVLLDRAICWDYQRHPDRIFDIAYDIDNMLRGKRCFNWNTRNISLDSQLNEGHVCFIKLFEILSINLGLAHFNSHVILYQQFNTNWIYCICGMLMTNEFLGFLQKWLREVHRRMRKKLK